MRRGRGYGRGSGGRYSQTPQAEGQPEKRKREDTVEDANTTPVRRAGACRACGDTGHQLGGCYYIFPSRAFEGWIPHNGMKRMIEEKINGDRELRNLVQNLRMNSAAQ